jgi:hypothetical protein
MFVSAFLFHFCFVFINLLLFSELRVDAWRLCQQCRRPEPRSVEDIGTWLTMLEIVSFAAVVCNSGLVAFTGTNTINYPWYNRVWIFFGMCVGIEMVRYLIALYVPDVPTDVEIQLERKEYYIKKIIHNVPDDEEDLLTKIDKTENRYVFRINDDDPL